MNVRLPCKRLTDYDPPVPFVKAEIIKALPKLQKIIAKRKKLKTP